ncbi:hypothetical protein BH18ACT15_BH18ACT15_04260 [soil metagenome]
MTQAASRRAPVQTFALVMGVTYLVIGIAGLAHAGIDGFFSSKETTLIIFPVNSLHSLVHIITGLLWLTSSRSPTSAAPVSLGIGVAYSVMTLLGAFGELDFLAVGGLFDSDNFLHLVTGGLALYFGLSATQTPSEDEPTSPGISG